jgi:hypothetical protein
LGKWNFPIWDFRGSGNQNVEKSAVIPPLGELSPSARFRLWWVEKAKREDLLSVPPPEFDRDEVLVCMALALCLAGASTSIIYRLLG